MTREESEKYIKSKMCNDCSVYLGGGKCSNNCKVIKAIKALEQEDITWIVGNDNVQIAVRNMPVDMMQKINAIIGNKQESVLDKIITEIKKLDTYYVNDFYIGNMDAMLKRDDVLHVLDKYKSESGNKL